MDFLSCIIASVWEFKGGRLSHNDRRWLHRIGRLKCRVIVPVKEKAASRVVGKEYRHGIRKRAGSAFLS